MAPLQNYHSFIHLLGSPRDQVNTWIVAWLYYFKAWRWLMPWRIKAVRRLTP